MNASTDGSRLRTHPLNAPKTPGMREDRRKDHGVSATKHFMNRSGLCKEKMKKNV
jgi:hypothetical protein